jgi:protein SCO1/2
VNSLFASIRVHSRQIFLLLAAAVPVLAQMQPAYKPVALRNVGIEQKMGAQVPVDIPFNDEFGHTVTLREYLHKPVILALVYYQCPSLCNMILNGVVRSARSLEMTAGKEYDVVAVSFDPRETPEMAAAKKASYVKEYNREGSEKGWHFLTGVETSSKALADAVGFRYNYDALTNQYAHGSAIIILTPEGHVARYFYGIDYPARDVRLGLVEASEGRISSPVDQVLLYCYHYDPANGKYGLVIMNVLRIAGLLTLACLLTFMTVMFRRDFRAAHAAWPHREST